MIERKSLCIVTLVKRQVMEKKNGERNQQNPSITHFYPEPVDTDVISLQHIHSELGTRNHAAEREHGIPPDHRRIVAKSVQGRNPDNSRPVKSLGENTSTTLPSLSFDYHSNHDWRIS